jgi:hypothetical protein
MKKNDKLIVILGVVILILAGIGIYYWTPEATGVKTAEIEDFYSVTSSYKTIPSGIEISDSNHFHALVATPLAINYDSDGMQHMIPLYIKNVNAPSDAVTRLQNQFEQMGNVAANEIKDMSCKEFSLYFAEKYWDYTDAVLLIESNETGYNLGVAAAPIASYLGIPVIVTDEIDPEVKEVLDNLGVKKSMVCGDLEGYGHVKKFETIDDVLESAIEIVREKFKHDIGYITLTNPKDAYPPEVLDTATPFHKEGTLKAGNALPSHVLDAMTFKAPVISFNIPEDYEYCLVKFDFKNKGNLENIEKFGDGFLIQGSLIGIGETCAYPAERDITGEITDDHFYYETVYYDMGGEELTIKPTPKYMTEKQGEYELTVNFEELSDPYYPLMPQLSSIAPYLTAYHQGIVFAKPEFAFAACDDVKLDGQTLPGNTQVWKNAELIPVVNKHIYDNIHKPLNELIAKIVDINISEDVEALTRYCRQTPFYVAVVGDTTMMPQYYYRSPHNDPFKHPDKMYGTGCPSDFIYGNIDPETYFMQAHVGAEDTEDDLYSTSEYPQMENIVGRITGYDVQDASALLVRTFFYDNLIDDLGDWKENAVVMTGAGAEVQKLPILYRIQALLGHSDPMKFPTGEKSFEVQRLAQGLEEGGFKAETAERGQAQREGLSDEALWEIKTDGILNLLFFPRILVKHAQGFENIKSLFDLEWWIESFSDGSGIKGEELQESSNIIISDSHAIWYSMVHGDSLVNTLGGPPILYQILARFLPIIPGFKTPLQNLGAYDVRSVSNMEMGPSVMLVEGCGSGKIDSLPPKNTIANTYLHAGVNAYVSPTTYSAFAGYLEPRHKSGVGFGIIGYLKTAFDAMFKNTYPEPHFCVNIFENTYEYLIDENLDIGTALMKAKNDFLPDQADRSYLWSPPLDEDSVETSSGGGGGTVILEKYCAVYQLNLLGDPAFNPYEPCNEG